MERKQLTVNEVLEPRPIGNRGTIKHSFKASDGLVYQTFSKSIAEHFKVGVVLDAEVEEKKREHQGNTYTDRVIEQLYVDGKPVAGQKGGFQGGGFRTDPETQIRIQEINRQSVEKQVAIKEIGEMLRAGAPVPDELTSMYWDGLEQMIARPRPQQGAPKTASHETQADRDFRALGSASEVPQTAGELAQWAWTNRGLRASDVVAMAQTLVADRQIRAMADIPKELLPKVFERVHAAPVQTKAKI